MNAVTTHEICAMPPRSPTMRGRAVLTMFWSSAASTIASSAPAITVFSRTGGASGRARKGDAVDDPRDGSARPDVAGTARLATSLSFTGGAALSVSLGDTPATEPAQTRLAVCLV